MRWYLAIPVCLASWTVSSADPVPAKPSPEQVEFFEKKVRPVLAEKCYSCHGEKKQSAGLRLDSAAAAKAGADDGPVIAPGTPGKSRLIGA